MQKFTVFRIVRSDGPYFTSVVHFFPFSEVRALDAASALQMANLMFPERKLHMAVQHAGPQD